MQTSTDIRQVHLMRHGQVANPDGVLYGQLPGFGLSELGHRMAERMGQYWEGVPLRYLACSPLLRARQTLEPTASRHPDLEVVIEPKVIEAYNVFEGKVFGADNRALRDIRMLHHVWNPFRPSWGEPYKDIVARMRAAIETAREQVGPGGQGLIVAHQLPIWLARCDAEGRRLFHDPRRRECTLASVTTLRFDGDSLVGVDYNEPAADLLPKRAGRRFQVGT